MATHLSILAWKILQTEEPGQLQSLESYRIGLIEHSTTLQHLVLEIYIYILINQAYLMTNRSSNITVRD